MHNLLTIVQDHHKKFLEDQGIFIGQEQAWSEVNLLISCSCSKLCRIWMKETNFENIFSKKFDLDGLPDIDEVDFPAKPESEKVK